MPYCVNCEGDLEKVKIFRETLCPHCDVHLHACVQCKFYEPSAHNQCLEPQSDPVANREIANFCEFFRIAGETVDDAPPKKRTSGGDHEARAKEARAQLEALFKKPGKSD